jgi:hypothetical protein
MVRRAGVEGVIAESNTPRRLEGIEWVQDSLKNNFCIIHWESLHGLMDAGVRGMKSIYIVVTN